MAEAYRKLRGGKPIFVSWFEPPPLDRKLVEKLKRVVQEAWNEKGN